MVDGTDGRIKREAKDEPQFFSSYAKDSRNSRTLHLGRFPCPLTRELILACFFCRFPITLASTLSTLQYIVCAVTRATLVLDIYGTVTPSVRRVMHRTLSHPVCTLQLAQPQIRASRCSPRCLGRPNNRRCLPSSTCCNNVGPSFGKKRMCCPRSGLLMIRERVTSHTSFSRARPRKTGPWRSIHGCAAVVELTLMRIACLVAMTLCRAAEWPPVAVSHGIEYWPPASAFE